MERNIFSYNNGKGLVKADPMNIYTRLISKDIDLEDDFARVRTLGRLASGDKPSQEIVSQSIEAYERLLEAARYAFKVEAYTGDEFTERGLTDTETFLLLAEFSRFMETQKKSTGTSPTSPQSTESESST